MTTSSAISIYVSIGLHVSAFVAALAFSGYGTEVPHYHLRQGTAEFEGSFGAAEATARKVHYLALYPFKEDSQTSLITAAAEVLAPAAMEIRPTDTSLTRRIPETKLPAAMEDCHCEAPEHEIKTPKRQLDTPPQLVASLEVPAEIRRRDFTPEFSVSTEVSLPGSVGSDGADVDQPARKFAANRQPPYPREALALGQQGRVVLEVHITWRGTVESLRVVESSGVESLDQSALETVKDWQFEPARRGGQPVATVVNVPVRFNLRS